MDRVTIGTTVLEVRSSALPDDAEIPVNTTLREMGTTRMAVAVGDIIGFTGLAERVGSDAVAAAIDTVFDAFTPILAAHGGALGNTLGDAYFAVFETGSDADRTQQALSFALAADERAREVAASLAVRSESGDPLRLGWAVALGDATRTAMRAGRPTLHGDIINLAFRVSGLAAREGRPAILADAAVRDAAGDVVSWGEPLEMTVKGRARPATLYGVSPR
jgi:class 3 adenylate cyclase